MFLKIFRNGLPKCKVAHSIRQSYLYTVAGNNDVQSKVSKEYPLQYYYLQMGDTIAFYYNKNNIIVYYIHSMRDNDLRVVPLYTYTKNDYEIILSPLAYNFTSHHVVCLVKAPNRQIYIVSNFVIANVRSGSRLYDFSRNTTYLFHSMPIANSFVVLVALMANEMLIHVIDLVKEKTYVQKYPLEKIIEALLSLSKIKDGYYEEIKYIENLDEVSFFVIDASNNSDTAIANNIDNSVTNSVFYHKCIINISLSFHDSKFNQKKLNDVISVIAVYQNNELIVKLQINSSAKLKAFRYEYDIDFRSTTILISNKYKADYDISKSYLYSVISFAGDYTIIREHNIFGISLYYKNEPAIVLEDKHFGINSFGDILFIRASNKKLVFIKKDKIYTLSKIIKYYIEYDDSDAGDNDSYVDIIETKPIQDLLINSPYKSNDTKWVGIEVTNIVKSVKLKGRFEEIIRRYFCSRNRFELFKYAHYIDYKSKEFYLLAYFECSETDRTIFYYYGRHKICLFKVKINHLFSDHMNFELVLEFEADVFNEDLPSIFNTLDSILNNLKTVTSNGYNISLRLFFKKLITRHKLTGLKVLRMYDRTKAYHDYGYNRKSIRTLPKESSIASNLHLVRRILPTF